MFNLILFGPPGSGKGTQAEKLIEKYKLVHISTGNLLRAEIEAKTPLGLEAKSIMANGKLVSDEIVIGMISKKFDENPHAGGFIFDGFPRTIAQAEALDKMMQEKKYRLNRVLSMEVSEQELVKRLLNRGKTSDRADDKNEDVIRKRIKEYWDKTFPVAGYYEQQNKLSGIEGEGSIDDIFNRLTTAIELQTNKV